MADETLVYLSRNDLHVNGYSAYSQKVRSNMRGLYEVFIVNIEDGSILGPYRAIARNAENAKLATVAAHIKTECIDDYDILTHHVGEVRPKVEK